MSDLKILVAFKKSRYEQFVLEERDPNVEELIAARHLSVERLKTSHRAHRTSLDHLIARLDSRGLPFDLEYRGDVTDLSGYDLVIAVGGDGTVLDLSHRAGSTPLLSINSDPDSSVGYFSAGSASDIDRLLDRILMHGWEPAHLRRFHIRLDGHLMGPPVLNDILISHANPAAVSSYSLKVGSHPAEAQKSSGIWVSTPAGSTAAVRSAGGFVLPYGSENIQYVVREPYPPAEGGYRFLKGIHPFDEHFEVISRMREGMVFLDGPHLSFPFPLGCTLVLEPDAPDLAIYGLQEERRTA
jgi:NAD+ kinase